jgi:rhamnose utilization protein RhaD (predicted bifunctional aldolase and dehydrogenase)
MSIQDLVDISHFYGANPEFVLAGGGNTSYKDDSTLYIKGSGTQLSDITADGFVRMDRKLLKAIWGKSYPADTEKRESAVLEDMMASRMKGEDAKRPSVETLLHDILPFIYVVHTHPALVNGLTCSKEGEQAMKELFAGDAVWISSTNPGYILSKKVKDAMEAYIIQKGKAPSIIFLQNHGIFVGADSIDDIKKHYEYVINKIGNKVTHTPDMTELPAPQNVAQKISEAVISAAKEILNDTEDWVTHFSLDKETSAFIKSREDFKPVSSAFTPDHIVYAGSEALYIENTENIENELKNYYAKNKHIPKTIAVQSIGIFGLGKTGKAAALAALLFKDSVKVAVYAQAYSGEKFMPPEQIDFINNWEVERYRSAVSVGK